MSGRVENGGKAPDQSAESCYAGGAKMGEDGWPDIAKVEGLDPSDSEPGGAAIERLDIDVQMERAKQEGNAPLLDALRRLKAKGVGKNTILGLGSSADGPSHRWFQCPYCKVYVDALLEPPEGGGPRLFYEEALVCPKCGAPGGDFDTVEADYMLPNLGDGTETVDKRKAALRVGLHRSFMAALEDARASIAQKNIFGNEDDQFSKDEPRWPRQMAAVVAGSAAYLGFVLNKAVSSLHRIEEMLKAERRQKGTPSEHKGHPPGTEAGDAFGDPEM